MDATTRYCQCRAFNAGCLSRDWRQFYYQAAQKVAVAIIFAQHSSGGWNYVADYAGEKSLKKWYATIGKQAWRLEEFHHYYGNATFDDMGTAEAAKFLLRLYLEKRDEQYRSPLNKAIDFILNSQYPVGGWPQRFPLVASHAKRPIILRSSLSMTMLLQRILIFVDVLSITG